MEEYTALQKLYATHVFEGKRTIEQVPEVIRDIVQQIVDEMTENAAEEY